MTARPSSWKGQARMGMGWGEFVGVTGDNTPHSHHAVQVLLAEQPQPLWTAAAGWQPVLGGVIGPELRHQLGSNGQPVRLLYIEPHSDSGRRLMATLDQGLRVLTAGEVTAACCALSGDQPPDTALARVLAPISKQINPQASDHEMESWIAALPTMMPEQLTAATCAHQLELSSSRFLHRFRAHTGLPLRPYLRWRRLLVAVREAMQGVSLTEAAHAAGFADAAHFTRTFRRHFGLAPSALIGMASSK